MKNSISEPARKTPVVHQTDVVIVGGSCTGVFAAVCAARMGMQVAIIEKQNCFGGVATAGAVNIWHSLHNTTGTQQIIGGLTAEVIERLKKRDAVRSPSTATGAFYLNTEELKIELDELVSEQKITAFLHSFYVAPAMEDGQLAAVIIENKNGRQAIRARQFIDATGDADLARHLGLGAPESGPLQSPTTCAKIKGFQSLKDFDWQEAICQHGEEFGLQKDWGWGDLIPGLTDIQLRADSHVFGCNAAQADQLTQAEIEGRRQVRAIMDLIRKYGPSTAHLTLVDLAASIGIRETRRVSACYRLTGNDVLYGQRFPDAIANGSYRVDIHHADCAGITFRYLDGREIIIPERGSLPRETRWREPLKKDPTFYQIPLRCLVQKQIPNLILAGRMLDADPIAFSAVRVMVNMNQTGEAAGTLAALAVRDTSVGSQIKPRHLQDELRKNGSIIIPDLSTDSGSSECDPSYLAE